MAKTGGWIPLDKNLAKALPRDRSFTELEAMFSLSLDFDNKNSVTISGYAARWGWNPKTVKRFLKKWGVAIEYPKSTKSIQNQRGQIKGQIKGQIRDRSRDRKGIDKGQISFIDLSGLKEKRDRKGIDKGQIAGQIRDRSRDTTINPINPDPVNPDPEEERQNSPKKPPEIISFPSKKLEWSFDQMKTAFLMSNHEIQAIYATCSNHDRLEEAVQCALEFDADLRKKGTTLNNPAACIQSCYNSRKQSAKTRYRKGMNEKNISEKVDPWDLAFEEAKKMGMI